VVMGWGGSEVGVAAWTFEDDSVAGSEMVVVLVDFFFLALGPGVGSMSQSWLLPSASGRVACESRGSDACWGCSNPCSSS